MKKQSTKAGGIQRISRVQPQEKAELDLKTSYLTLLPHMDEGFHTGYQPRPGIVNDTNQKPHEWLENVANYMQTQGEDVGYSIPDVLAGEQQMRRLLRLPHAEAMRHQDMINWRAILALLLLWDDWEKDETWPTVTFENYLSEESLKGAMAFQRTVGAALSEERKLGGLKVFAIARQHDLKQDIRPLCLVSHAIILMPAANPGDLGELLPKQVRWYDRGRKRFLDPCAYLEESDRTRLTMQLRLLQFMNEQAEIGSYLYSPDALLCSPLERFIDDLQDFRGTWREKLERRDETAVRALYTRALAVYGLWDQAWDMKIQGLAGESKRLDISSLRQNLLISCLMPLGSVLPNVISDVTQQQYLLDGVPFARASMNWLLEPTNHPGEENALRRLAREVALLNDFSGMWNAHMAMRFDELYRQMKTRVGVSPVVLRLLQEWQAKHGEFPMQRDRSITLNYPIEGHPRTLGFLLSNLLGFTDVDGICDAFSESLLLITEADRAPFDNPLLCEVCRVRGATDSPEQRGAEQYAVEQYAIPPLSPWLSAWLMDQAELDDPFAARLLPESLSFIKDAETGAVQASFCIACRKQGEDAMLTNSVTFCRSYAAQSGVGGVTELNAKALPFVVSWPNVRLSRDLWKQYFVYAHRPEMIDVWVRQESAWERGTFRQTADVSVRGRTRQRTWQTAATERYPSYVVLKKGALTLGALMNDEPRVQLKHEPAAIVGIDFGSIATTVMMRQGDKVQPAIFPKCLHAGLLHAAQEDQQYLTDEFLPRDVLIIRPENSASKDRESTFYSVMDMFSDDQQSWRNVLRDGHIYYRESLADLMRKNENVLYYDMKWSDEAYVLQCMRLFLKQVMLQAALSARLGGAASISWRISMPNALPLPRQEAYLEMMRGLSKEIAAKTGMPLTPEVSSVLYVTENQADGLYFRGRNEVNVRGGYINMDIGGGTTDISCWLNNAQRATRETSLLLGCRQMLFDSVFTRHLDAFEHDFETSGERMKTVVRNITQSFAAAGTNTRSRQKCMFLLDDFFADYDREIWKMMAQVRSEGLISYVESLLLLNIGFLFHMCGEMLNRVWQDEQMRDHLHSRMEICIAGNGGQLLKAFDNETRAKLCRLALQALEEGHPVRELLLVQSRHPKQEVAIGLLSEEQHMRSIIQGEDGVTGSLEEPVERERHRVMMHSFPVRFFATFPQAAERLLPLVFERQQLQKGIALTPSAMVELDTVLDNEFLVGGEDDFTVYARCFAAMKRLWRV